MCGLCLWSFSSLAILNILSVLIILFMYLSYLTKQNLKVIKIKYINSCKHRTLINLYLTLKHHKIPKKKKFKTTSNKNG